MKKLMQISALLLWGVSMIRADCIPSPTKVEGTKAPQQVCSGQLIFEDDFNTFDPSVWRREVSMGNGGNDQFSMYNDSQKNVFVKDGILYLKPSLTADDIGEAALTSELLQLGARCNNPAFNGCSHQGTPNDPIPPVTSGLVSTTTSFAFTYGNITFRAKMPGGDWEWPALWMQPQDIAYGIWPKSGEIDIAESRGNENYKQDGKLIGNQHVGATLHFGTDWDQDGWGHATYSQDEPKGYAHDFHTYTCVWSPTNIAFFYDGVAIGSVVPPSGGFYQLGQFWQPDPWTGGGFMAPFDKPFFIMMNNAVGGKSYFPDNAVNSPSSKPWINGNPDSAAKFWAARNDWEQNWDLKNSDKAALQIDYVRVYAL